MSRVRAAGGSADMSSFTLTGPDITTFDFDLGPSDLYLNLGDIDDQACGSISLSPMRPTEDPNDESNEALARLEVSDPEQSATGQQVGSSATTNFTRSQNWVQHILDEMKDMLLVLTADGRILFASPACRSVTGQDPEQLHGTFLSHFVHDDDKRTFIREFNESIATGHNVRFHYRFRNSDGSYVILEASGHPHIAKKQVTLGTGKTGYPCDGFFLICRPYPTRSCQLLDSFLEQKVENIRLMRRIAELKREEEEELKAQQQFFNNSNQTLEVERQHPEASSASTEAGLLPRSAAVDVSESGIGVGTQTDNSSCIEGIEMMTGLHYREGERSQGLSTGESDGRLIQDDADIALLADQLRRSPSVSDKKKKLKTSEEYVCTDCGTLASPEWRKGPSGPKTLCNACGLRWAKKVKKHQV